MTAYTLEHTDTVLFARLVPILLYAHLVIENPRTFEVAQFVDWRCPWLVLTAAMAFLCEVWSMTVLEAVWYKNGIRALWQLLFPL